MRMSLRLHPLLALASLLGLLSLAAGARAASSPVGYDLSYPQCEAPAPLAPSFVVVGVNGGLANDPNPCLATQLTLAGAAPGLTRPRQPGLSLYLIAADPGNRVADWPSAATTTSSVSTPYGTCDGSWSRACAFLYGEQRAGYSYALAAAIAPATAASAPWWIDVEIEASWAKPGGSREWSDLNIAALRGYTAGLRGRGRAWIDRLVLQRLSVACRHGTGTALEPNLFSRRPTRLGDRLEPLGKRTAHVLKAIQREHRGARAVHRRHPRPRLRVPADAQAHTDPQPIALAPGLFHLPRAPHRGDIHRGARLA